MIKKKQAIKKPTVARNIQPYMNFEPLILIEFSSVFILIKLFPPTKVTVPTEMKSYLYLKAWLKGALLG
jgi:hypothetical protein